MAWEKGLDFFEIVGLFPMRSVISAARVAGNDALRQIPPSADGGTLRGSFGEEILDKKAFPVTGKALFFCSQKVFKISLLWNVVERDIL